MASRTKKALRSMLFHTGSSPGYTGAAGYGSDLTNRRKLRFIIHLTGSLVISPFR